MCTVYTTRIQENMECIGNLFTHHIDVGHAVIIDRMKSAFNYTFVDSWSIIFNQQSQKLHNILWKKLSGQH